MEEIEDPPKATDQCKLGVELQLQPEPVQEGRVLASARENARKQ